MKKELMEMLICPACLPEEFALELSALDKENGEIREGTLNCPNCDREYSILEGIAYLDPGHKPEQDSGNKYETPQALSSYLWSHYADLLSDPQASRAYALWAEQIHPHSGICLDAGTAVGRFAFEMTTKCDFVIGLDNSVHFIKAARELLLKGEKILSLPLPVEGHLRQEVLLQLPKGFDSSKAEFIVADAQALPFKKQTFSSLASLNMLDKVPKPINHLREINRVARQEGVECLVSDPFSWSQEVAREEDWLGGKENGTFSGRGLDNLEELFKDNPGLLPPKWQVQSRDSVWWKIRTHSNHFELIRSCYMKAVR